MKTIKHEKLQEIFKKHDEWLGNNQNGSKANLSWANLSGADLSEANLSEANLSEANLSEANLSEADLRWANLSEADLSEADLRWANLRGADLSESNLRGADLRGADIDFSSLPLWCGSLKAHYDERQIIQIAYHLLSVIKKSRHSTDELKEIFLTDRIKEIANKFHRIGEHNVDEI